MRTRMLGIWVGTLLLLWLAFGQGCGDPGFVGIASEDSGVIRQASLSGVTTIQAENFSRKTAGRQVGESWLLFSQDEIAHTVHLPSNGFYKITVYAFGEFAPYWPEIQLLINGVPHETRLIDTGTVAERVYQLDLRAGAHELAVKHFNADGAKGPNLYIDRVSIELLQAAPMPLPPQDQSSPPVAQGPKLRWAPPLLSNPETVVLGTDRTTTNMDPNKDYVIKLPPKLKTGATVLQGGRNVVIVGGYISIPPTDRSKQGDDWRRGIFIQNNNGTVHVEGVLFDASAGGEADFIALQSPNTILQVQNCRAMNLKGSQDTNHSDFIQPWGGVKELRVDRFTGSSNYQGFFIREDLGPIGKAILQNVNVAAQPNQSGTGGYMLWMSEYPIELSEFYVLPNYGNIAKAVWPAPNINGSEACWNFVKGCVKNGKPAMDFVPAGVPGFNYQPPGYMEQ